ncbi:acyl carrier protein [Candidatus Hecatella orcuttiae]|jgi:acyl carrier protein|uniref:acyl carrier protein n=1 Tax=Candidatus Hecatella orcuttiae TaxID=1935119 RepID=UPI002867F97F|nr:acyl carrier protein [Candidatus Hecatella orcuttiae]
MSVEKKVKEIIADVFGKNPEELADNLRFVEDLHAKSVNIIELIALLEYEFNITIPFVEARKNKTIGEAVSYIEKKLAEKQ